MNLVLQTDLSDDDADKTTRSNLSFSTFNFKGNYCFLKLQRLSKLDHNMLLWSIFATDLAEKLNESPWLMEAAPLPVCFWNNKIIQSL